MSLRHALLGLLDLGPNSGYGLAKLFENPLRQIWNARNHQLYPELARLSADGKLYTCLFAVDGHDLRGVVVDTGNRD